MRISKAMQPMKIFNMLTCLLSVDYFKQLIDKILVSRKSYEIKIMITTHLWGWNTCAPSSPLSLGAHECQIFLKSVGSPSDLLHTEQVAELNFYHQPAFPGLQHPPIVKTMFTDITFY